jgi:hypothetical protein
MKICSDCLANSARYQEGDRVWLYCLNRTRGKSPKLQAAWEGPYKVITHNNNIVYKIQLHPRVKMMVVHLERLLRMVCLEEGVVSSELSGVGGLSGHTSLSGNIKFPPLSSRLLQTAWAATREVSKL